MKVWAREEKNTLINITIYRHLKNVMPFTIITIIIQRKKKLQKLLKPKEFNRNVTPVTLIPSVSVCL